MENTDVLIIGGSASGIVTAVTGKSNYPDKTFMVVRKEKQVVVPCGIPYIFGSLDGSDKNLIPDTVLENPGIKLKVDEAISVDLEKKICKTSDGTEIGFDKLVFATGSDTKVPNWLKGADKENVFTIPKDKIYLDKALSKLKDCKKIVVVGGGFIGVEVSDELNKKNKDVTIVEILPHVLSLAFDKEMAVRAEEILKSRGVKIKSGVGVKEILDFFTRKTSSIMLASTACAEARIAGMSLYKLSAVKTFGGTIAIFSTAIGDTGFGVAGLTEDMARKEGFDIVEGSFEGIDKHPGTLPGTNKQMIKLVVAKDSGMILGGGVIGGLSAGELTNILGFVIQNKMTINSLLTAQIGTHPLVTAPPTAYPLIKAAEVVSKKL
ncbi:pyridine nucleotide-disulfide oxidoreductase [Thermoplasmatales archaeon ex4572_165]|nr:MAG: pyridine nucleotide-disulfide oxidoreductase [Thermoplasmatales archaeon ex4572_165]